MNILIDKGRIQRESVSNLRVGHFNRFIVLQYPNYRCFNDIPSAEYENGEIFGLFSSFLSLSKTIKRYHTPPF